MEYEEDEEEFLAVAHFGGGSAGIMAQSIPSQKSHVPFQKSNSSFLGPTISFSPLTQASALSPRPLSNPLIIRICILTI